MALLTITVCDPSSPFRTLSHGGVSGGPFSEGSYVQGQTSGTIALVSSVKDSFTIVVELIGKGTFQNGEVIVQTSGPYAGTEATLNAEPAEDTAEVVLQDDQKNYKTTRGQVKGIDLVVGDEVHVMTNQGFFKICSIP